MRVVSETLVPWDRTLDRPVGGALARRHVRAGVVLQLRDETGRIGQGEAAPLPGYSSETLSDCTASLRNLHATLSVVDPGDPLAALGTLAALPSAARFALETALCDLAGQRRGVSLAVCLGGVARPGAIALHAQPGAATDPELVAEARRLVSRGFRTLKVKIGGDFDRERAALVRLREAVGPGVSLRLDANGAWSLDGARRRLADLAPLAPEFVEQPVPGADLLALGPCAVPWAADESLVDPSVAEALLGAGPSGGCAAFVVKPALLGGLSAARSLALRAQARGFGVVVTHLFDGPVGLAAACALALSLPSPPWACGLAAHPGLAGGAAAVRYLTAGGTVVSATDAPGLGVGLMGPGEGS